MPEEEIAEGLLAAHEGIRELCRIQREFLGPVQQPKMEWTKVEIDDALRARVEELSTTRIGEAMTIADNGSSHHHPKRALAPSPTSSTPDSIAQMSV